MVKQEFWYTNSFTPKQLYFIDADTIKSSYVFQDSSASALILNQSTIFQEMITPSLGRVLDNS